MIANARVLQEDFVPRDVEHRNGEINRLSTALEPLLSGEPAETPLVFGPTGAGKTCVARYTTERLRERLLDVRTTYVNCWTDHTRFGVLYTLLEAIGRTADIHRQSTPHDELLRRIRDADDVPFVAILDEVDQLDDPDLLYELCGVPHLHPILIANREADFFAGLDERVQSRLRAGPRVRFDRYGIEELVAILTARVERGFEPGTVDQARLETIADAAAGDARVAIRILRAAARKAEADGAGQLTEDHIEAAIPAARDAIRQRTVDALTPHQEALFELIEAAGEISPGELYERYTAAVDEPKSRRTVRKYLSKMDQYNLVDARGEKRGRTYAIVD
ncbi:MAG: Cdc6/Cdc18 family protein [Salinirussus sp.]